MFSPEAAKVFGHDTVDLADIYIIHHAFERGSLEVRSRPSVIDVFVNDVQAVFGSIFAQDCALRLDAHAVSVTLIVSAQAHVQCRVEIRLAVLVHGIKRGVVQCGLGFALGCPLLEQFFGWGVGVVALGYVVSQVVPPKCSKISTEGVVKRDPLGVGCGVSP